VGGPAGQHPPPRGGAWPSPPGSPSARGLSVSAANGRRKPPRPQIEIQSTSASPEEAAAIAAAIERFLWETAPAPGPAPRSRWQEAALREGVSVHSQLAGGWGTGQ